MKPRFRACMQIYARWAVQGLPTHVSHVPQLWLVALFFMIFGYRHPVRSYPCVHLV